MSVVRDAVRLRSLLGGEAWAWWRDRARKALEERRPVPATITLSNPTAAEREAANRLFGTPGAIGPIRVRTAALETLLRDAGIADDVPCALIALGGPVRDLPAERQAASDEWMKVHRMLRERLARFAELQQLDALVEAGLLLRLSANQTRDAEALIQQAEQVLLSLETAPKPLPLAVLSARSFGDAHALDRDRSLGRFVLRLKGLGQDDSALGWRAAWNGIGVTADNVSASALTLNLPTRGDGRLARVLAAMRGEPVRLTARQLEADGGPFLVQGTRVFVCENPTVVAQAANSLGAECPPMVCVDGWPTTPTLMLLQRLERDGGVLVYQGDADWPGLLIQAELRRHVNLRPWRLTANGLRECRDRPGPPLEGAQIATDWEPELSTVLLERARALHEETVVDLLIADLTAGRTK